MDKYSEMIGLFAMKIETERISVLRHLLNYSFALEDWAKEHLEAELRTRLNRKRAQDPKGFK